MIFSRILKKYSNYLNRNPYLGVMYSSAIIASTGDFFVQCFIEKKSIIRSKKNKDLDSFDWTRYIRAAVIGFGILAPVNLLWYRIMVPRILARYKHTFMIKNFQNVSIVCLGIFQSVLYLNYLKLIN